MAEQITIPGVGPVDRKYVIIGGVVVAGAVFWFWTHRNQTPGGADTPTIDPLTGLPYTTENQPQTGYVNPNPVQSVIDQTTGDIKTNADWTAAVTDKLGNIGIDPQYLADVLGKYLGGQAVTLTEAATIRIAWAYVGKPPQGPDTIKLTTGTSNPGGGGGTPGPTPKTTSAVLKGWHVNQWINDVRAGKVDGVPYPAFSWSLFIGLNPQANGNIDWSQNSKSSDLNTFKSNATYRIR
jgi:hypothetical protein